MTSPTNDHHAANAPNDLPPMSPDAAPWEDVGYRDENARLLVSAMLRRREELLQQYPDVPVQGYDVIPPERGPAGTVTCGVLITLWQHSELCRGECRRCDGTAVAFAVGGNDDAWFVTGVCPLCGFFVYRKAAPDNLLASLAHSLEGSDFTLPTQNQFLLGNAHQHLAIIGALRALGEQLLPPDHYGFAVNSPDSMARWRSAAIERTHIWTGRAGLLHAATGARVEKTESTWTCMAQYVREFLLRTGTLPELDHDGPDGLRYSFPMISQDPVSFRRTDPQTDETLAGLDSDALFQRAVDRLVADWRAKRPVGQALECVTQMMLDRGQVSASEDCIGVFLGPSAMSAAFCAIDDDAVREAMELADRRVTQAHRIHFFEQCVLENLLQDADVTRAFVPLVLQASDGDAVQLVSGISGYSFSGLEFEWHGPLAVDFDVAKWLRKEGWVETVEEFQGMSAKRKLAVVTGAA